MRWLICFRHRLRLAIQVAPACLRDPHGRLLNTACDVIAMGVFRKMKFLDKMRMHPNAYLLEFQTNFLCLAKDYVHHTLVHTRNMFHMRRQRRICRELRVRIKQ